jgi:hypothetical protein
MSVWFAIPSARPPEEAEPVLLAWRDRGYKIALARDHGAPRIEDDLPLLIFEQAYPGYAIAVNRLVEDILKFDPQCDWIVTGGDDVLPDPNHSAEEIATQCTERFGGPFANYGHNRPQNTFGVMQPTGDRDFGDAQGPYIDRVAGSPWMGREWCLRANQGKGPLYPGFRHMFVDECLQEVAIKLGVFWQRPDLVQKHEHWGRPREGETMGQADRIREHAKKWNTRSHWDESKALLEKLRADEFKECMPL